MKFYILFLIELISNIKWNFLLFKDKLFDSILKADLERNRIFRNLHSGERCFLVGNGPSLNKMDLSMLKDEFVFTANEIMRSDEIYKTLNSDYHFIIDPAYYNLKFSDEHESNLIEILIKISKPSGSPVCFVGVEGKSSFQNYRIVDNSKLFYLYQHKHFIDCINSIDLSSNLPIAYNVLHSCIYAAIYMGFKDIYIIGCDMTSAFLSFEYNDSGKRDILNNYHSYEYKDGDKNLMLLHNNSDNEFKLLDTALQFSTFKKIKKYADRNKINIYNAGVGGGLDVFTRISYNSLFQ